MNDSFNRFKFRVWNKKTKKMKKVMALISEEGVYYSLIVRDNKAVITPCQEPYMVLMQCTGLKDKNGKLVFEGDICSNNNGELYQAYYYEEDAAIYLKSCDGGVMLVCSDVEVIGNIYENPELLEDK